MMHVMQRLKKQNQLINLIFIDNSDLDEKMEILATKAELKVE